MFSKSPRNKMICCSKTTLLVIMLLIGLNSTAVTRGESNVGYIRGLVDFINSRVRTHDNYMKHFRDLILKNSFYRNLNLLKYFQRKIITLQN